MRAFWGKGYLGTSMSELTACMEIARESLYRTYGGKKELFLEALDRYSREMFGRLVEILRGPGSPLQNLDRLFQLYRDCSRESGENGCMLVNSFAEFGRRDPELEEILRSHLKLIRGAFEDVLQRAQAAGEISMQADIEGLANLVFNLLQGLSLTGKVENDPERLRCAHDEILRILRSS